MSRNDDDIRIRPVPPRDHGTAQSPRFISRVVRSSSKAGRSLGRTLTPRKASSRSTFGRGHIAAQLAGRGLDHRARRVVVKTRLVLLQRAGARSTQKHLRYLERDGVTRDGERGQLYGPETDIADGDAFDQRSRGDRHQFRFIVSAQDALELEDLKAFTREHMAQMQRDLGTRLDWVAVDHWDTDNPHTHIVLRGKDDRGADLVIARDYIGHGMRQRGAEIATRWLGRRSERELAHAREREVTQSRWTGLDHTLSAAAREGVVDLRDVPGELGKRRHRNLLLGRLDHLSKLGLAQRSHDATWTLHPDAERTLRAMGERNDIIRTLQRALGSGQRDYAIWQPKPGDTLRGRVIGKGLHDELHERGYLVVESADGRAHYVALTGRSELSRYRLHGPVRLRGIPARGTPGRVHVLVQSIRDHTPGRSPK